jgi:hypothetical protein
MRVLELFSGTGSVGKAFSAKNWEVVSLDLDPACNATHCCDILQWVCLYPPIHFDVIWASPDCRFYSLARSTAKTPRDLQLADSLVLRTLSLIFYLKPKFWFIENPQTGLLKTRAFMHGLPYKDVSYCSYGLPYRKLTRIWTNCSEWQPRALCVKDQCPFVKDGRHIATAQGGPGKIRGVRMINDRFARRELYGIPAALCEDIVDCLTENLVV